MPVRKLTTPEAGLEPLLPSVWDGIWDATTRAVSQKPGKTIKSKGRDWAPEVGELTEPGASTQLERDRPSQLTRHHYGRKPDNLGMNSNEGERTGSLREPGSARQQQRGQHPCSGTGQVPQQTKEKHKNDARLHWWSRDREVHKGGNSWDLPLDQGLQTSKERKKIFYSQSN